MNKEIIFVNYYPGSFGDTIASMFDTQSLNINSDGLVIADLGVFKQLEFYAGSPEEQQQELSSLFEVNKKAYACHRRWAFDFTKFINCRVVSIVIDDFLPEISNRCQRIPKWTIENPVISKIVDKKSELFSLALIKDYQSWKRANILTTDIKLDLATMLDPTSMKEWCAVNKLNYNTDHMLSIAERLYGTN